MKAEIYYLSSLETLKKVSARLFEIIPNGTVKVTFSDAGNKSSKQRGLDWKWNDEIAKSGIGGEHEDTKEGVHIVSKWRFAVRILQRDDDFFAGLYDGWCKNREGDSRAIMWFMENHISTEQFTISQMAEYLTEKQHYYLRKGVNLTDPEFRNLLEYEN